jgi:hypothetical protein
MDTNLVQKSPAAEKKKKRRKREDPNDLLLEEPEDYEDGDVEEASPYLPGTSTAPPVQQKPPSSPSSGSNSRKTSITSQPSTLAAAARLLPDGRKLSNIHGFIMNRLPSGEAREKYLRELIDFKAVDVVVEKKKVAGVNEGLRKLSTAVRSFLIWGFSLSVHLGCLFGGWAWVICFEKIKGKLAFQSFSKQKVSRLSFHTSNKIPQTERRIIKPSPNKHLKSQ